MRGYNLGKLGVDSFDYFTEADIQEFSLVQRLANELRSLYPNTKATKDIDRTLELIAELKVMLKKLAPLSLASHRDVEYDPLKRGLVLNVAVEVYGWENR